MELFGVPAASVQAVTSEVHAHAAQGHVFAVWFDGEDFICVFGERGDSPRAVQLFFEQVCPRVLPEVGT